MELSTICTCSLNITQTYHSKNSTKNIKIILFFIKIKKTSFSKLFYFWVVKNLRADI